MRPIGLGLRYVRRRKGRYALTALGVVLGVANVFGVLVANASINRAFEGSFGRYAGGADVRVWAQDFLQGLPTDTVNDYRALRGVRAALAVGMWRQTDDEVRYVGADTTGFDQLYAGSIALGRRFNVGAREVVLSHQAARHLDVDVGDLVFVADDRPLFEVVGVLAPEAPVDADVLGMGFGPLDVFGEMTAGEADVFEIRIHLDEGTEAPAWVDEHRRHLERHTFDFSGITDEFRRFLDNIQGTLSSAAALALFVGGFLIYLTFSMSVVERTRTYGTLLALGATPRQVRRIVRAEALVMGTIATLAGIAVGLVLAIALMRMMSSIFGGIRAPLTVPPAAVAVAFVLGLVVALASAYAPARRAGRLQAVDAMRSLHTVASRPSRAWIAGVVLFVGGVAFGSATRGITVPDALAGLVFVVVLLGAVLLVPPVLGPLARVARRLFGRSARGLGDVAVLHLVRERSRSAYTLGLVMVVLSILFAVATTNLSLHRSLDDLIERRFGADLLVYAQGVPPSVAETIRADPEVRSFVAVTLDRVEVIGPVPLGSRSIMVVDTADLFDAVGFSWTSGDDRTARATLARGGSVLVTSTMAVELDVSTGDEVRLRSSGRERSFEIAGVYAAFGSGPELGLVADERDRDALDIDATHDAYYINTVDADDDRSVEQLVRQELTSHELTPFVNTGSQVRDDAREDVAAWFRLFFAIVLVAAVVGMLALANTMAASILQRSREIGALRALGASDRDVRRMVVVESGTLASIAFVLSLALGLLLAILLVGAFRAASGVDVPFVYPWRWIPILGALAVGIAVAASLAPARRAARVTPVEALRDE